MCAMSGELTINLRKLQDNYQILDKLSSASCETAASVKADSYGLGITHTAPALWQAGARRFFVATVEEGISLRKILPEAVIYTLNGFWEPLANEYKHYKIIPVLNSLYEIGRYQSFAKQVGEVLPAILHFDTGMNRLGIPSCEADTLAQDKALLDGIKLDYIMSHFSSSDEKSSSANERQYKIFKNIAKSYPNVKYSLCNSGGVFLSEKYHFDLTRPGIALYGGRPVLNMENIMHPVVSLKVPILQVFSVKQGETCGYNETYRFDKNSKIAIASIGYADGVSRVLCNSASLYFNGKKMPIRGRISMDLIICEITGFSEGEMPKPGDMAEVIGMHQTLDNLARDAGTISYEILTSLSARYSRSYIT